MLAIEPGWSTGTSPSDMIAALTPGLAISRARSAKDKCVNFMYVGRRWNA
ncbi:unannotated protein [freshwater metagenome]|uniref:Unannotated protein n=1 Tax=freshwater metagenome TaxID=449393 RepID=A0A6J7VMW9_9ZZZZ